MSGSPAAPDDAFFGSIREILAEARRKAATNVNFIMVEAYWRIGARMVGQEQKGEARAAYGRELIKELSRRLGDEFGRGCSVANLWNFRQFYLTFPDLGLMRENSTRCVENWAGLIPAWQIPARIKVTHCVAH